MEKQPVLFPRAISLFSPEVAAVLAQVFYYNMALSPTALPAPNFQCSRVSVFQKFQRELSTKWVLNTVSTGAHVLLGKMLQNHMLDLRIANSKLFWRTLAMLQVGACQETPPNPDCHRRCFFCNVGEG